MAETWKGQREGLATDRKRTDHDLWVNSQVESLKRKLEKFEEEEDRRSYDVRGNEMKRREWRLKSKKELKLKNGKERRWGRKLQKIVETQFYVLYVVN